MGPLPIEMITVRVLSPRVLSGISRSEPRMDCVGPGGGGVERALLIV